METNAKLEVESETNEERAARGAFPDIDDVASFNSIESDKETPSLERSVRAASSCFWDCLWPSLCVGMTFGNVPCPACGC